MYLADHVIVFYFCWKNYPKQLVEINVKQWVTDLVEAQSIARYDGRIRVLLDIIDVFYCKMRQKDRNPKHLRRMIAKNFPMALFRIWER